MRVGLNQPIMREVLGKTMEPTESEGLIESVTEKSAEASPVVGDQPVKRINKGLKKYKSMLKKLTSRVYDKVVNPKVVKSKAAAVLMSLTKVPRPNENGQGAGATNGGREKEN